MRRSFSKFYPSTINRPSLISSSSTSTFSTSSGATGGGAGGGGGGGRGRGRASISPKFQFTKEDDAAIPADNASFPGFGHGQGGGRGKISSKPLPSSPVPPPSPSFVDESSTPVPGRGRGRGRGVGVGLGPSPGLVTPPAPTPAQPADPSRKAIFSTKDEGEAPHDSHFPPPTQSPNDSHFPLPTQSPRVPHSPEDTLLSSGILTVLSGAGRGKPPRAPSPVRDKPKEENRHIRARQQPPGATKEDSSTNSAAALTQQLTREEAVKKAIGILSKGGDDGRADGARGGRGGGGLRVRGGRGGRGFQAGRGRGEWGRRESFEDADDDNASELYLGDDADGEKLAKKLGPDVMDRLTEGFEEMSNRVLPSPADEAYLDALHTNLLVKYFTNNYLI